MRPRLLRRADEPRKGETQGGNVSVTLLSASGRSVVVRVHAGQTDAQACKAALREAVKLHGNQGWRPAVVL
jgi:hypothetical protein